jgi:ElaB/YqjD/DUF883 family membrane-anchored ribosome-binding protein
MSKNNISTDTLKRDIRTLADDATKLAQTRVMDPAMSAVRHARDAVFDRATQAERYTAEQCDHVAHWITSRPFTAVALAFVAGMLADRMLGHGAGRRG